MFLQRPYVPNQPLGPDRTFRKLGFQVPSPFRPLDQLRVESPILVLLMPQRPRPWVPIPLQEFADELTVPFRSMAPRRNRQRPRFLVHDSILRVVLCMDAHVRETGIRQHLPQTGFTEAA